MPPPLPAIRSTTVVGIRRDGQVALAADGQVTLGETAVKHAARKVLRIADGKVLAGFAGAAADAMALLDKFEGKIREGRGTLQRAAIEFVKEWRTDRMLRRLEAMMVVADREDLLIVGGTGDVIRPDDGIAAIGSGGPFAHAAARALLSHTAMPAEEIARESLRVAAGICIYTNDHVTVETLTSDTD
jgi:ATP-dependent HslUV protease, peptidase subunit HslV